MKLKQFLFVSHVIVLRPKRFVNVVINDTCALSGFQEVEGCHSTQHCKFEAITNLVFSRVSLPAVLQLSF